MRGHKCARLLYLEVPDCIVEEPDEDEQPPAEEAPFDPDKPMISLSAATGIRARDTMQLCLQLGNQEFTVHSLLEHH